MSGKEGIIKQFTFDARNALSEALEKKEGIEKKVSYQYNGLGNRVGQAWGDALDSERQIHYTIDITKQYHNMLSETIETEDSIHTSQYYYDFNVVAMKKAAGAEYFIQDDLGSAMSVYDQSGALEEAYAYDEFGNEYGNIIDARERFQPFGYTGYQKEAVGNVYFVQARRYDATSGRFVSEDIVRGAIVLPISINHYIYCMNQPEDLIDLDGRYPQNPGLYAGVTQDEFEYLNDSKMKRDKNKSDKKKNSNLKISLYESYNKSQVINAQRIEFEMDLAQTDMGKVVYSSEIIVLTAILVQNPKVFSDGFLSAVEAGASNKMTGGSFANGYVGGSLEGIIDGIGKDRNLVNMLGGFCGDTLTQKLDNPDETLNIAQSAVAAGRSLFDCGLIRKGEDIPLDTSAKIILKIFEELINFNGNLCGNILTNKLLDFVKQKIEKKCCEVIT